MDKFHIGDIVQVVFDKLERYEKLYHKVSTSHIVGLEGIYGKVIKIYTDEQGVDVAIVYVDESWNLCFDVDELVKVL